MSTVGLSPVLTEFWDHPQSWTMDTYLDHGGYEGLKKPSPWTLQPSSKK